MDCLLAVFISLDVFSGFGILPALNFDLSGARGGFFLIGLVG